MATHAAFEAQPANFDTTWGWALHVGVFLIRVVSLLMSAVFLRLAEEDLTAVCQKSMAPVWGSWLLETFAPSFFA